MARRRPVITSSPADFGARERDFGAVGFGVTSAGATFVLTTTDATVSGAGVTL